MSHVKKMSNPLDALPTPTYFSALAANYSRQTGNTTLTLFDRVLQKYIHSTRPILPSSVVHDNAAGPGTASGALLERLGEDGFPGEVLISDNNKMMVNGARETFAPFSERMNGEKKIRCEELDSEDLSSLVEDNYFTHSIMNFSIFNIVNSEKALREIYRTLKPGGLAIISCWKRFGAGEVVAAAQALVRPDLPSIPICGPEWFEEGVLAGKMAEAGFEKGNIQTLREDITIGEGEGVEGLKSLFLGPLMKRAREKWTEEEEARWPEVVEEAIKGEVERFGGVKFESWFVLAIK